MSRGAPWFLALVLQQHLPRHGWQVQLLLRAMLVCIPIVHQCPEQVPPLHRSKAHVQSRSLSLEVVPGKVEGEGTEGVPDKAPVVATNPGHEDLQVVHAEGNEGVPDKGPVVATNPGQEDLQVVHAERTERVPDKALVVATNPTQEDRKLVQIQSRV